MVASLCRGSLRAKPGGTELLAGAVYSFPIGFLARFISTDSKVGRRVRVSTEQSRSGNEATISTIVQLRQNTEERQLSRASQGVSVLGGQEGEWSYKLRHALLAAVFIFEYTKRSTWTFHSIYLLCCFYRSYHLGQTQLGLSRVQQ